LPWPANHRPSSCLLEEIDLFRVPSLSPPCVRAGGALLVLCGWLGCSLFAAAGVPLHERIDQAVAAHPDFDRHAAPPAPDADVVLAGTIPPADVARAFLRDSSPDKRRLLLDRLLASPENARLLQNVFDVLWLERRPDKYVPRAAWQDYLRSSFAENKPWDQL